LRKVGGPAALFELAEDGVAELLVEGERLEVEGVEVGADAAVLAGDGFGLLHETGAEVLVAGVRRDNEVFNVHPAVGAAAEETAANFAFFVFDGEDDSEEFRGGAVVEVELLQRGGDGDDVRLLEFWFVNDVVGHGVFAPVTCKE
jgi:hypothetical protein